MVLRTRLARWKAAGLDCRCRQGRMSAPRTCRANLSRNTCAEVCGRSWVRIRSAIIRVQRQSNNSPVGGAPVVVRVSVILLGPKAGHAVIRPRKASQGQQKPGDHARRRCRAEDGTTAATATRPALAGHHAHFTRARHEAGRGAHLRHRWCRRATNSQAPPRCCC